MAWLCRHRGDQAEHEIPGRYPGDPDRASAIWNDEAAREEVFRLLDARILPDLCRSTSRPGMHLWRTLVLGELKQGLDGDYDRLVRLTSCSPANTEQFTAQGVRVHVNSPANCSE